MCGEQSIHPIKGGVTKVGHQKCAELVRFSLCFHVVSPRHFHGKVNKSGVAKSIVHSANATDLAMVRGAGQVSAATPD